MKKHNQVRNTLFVSILIYFGILFVSCGDNTHPKVKLERITINPEKITNINLSSFCENISYIKLETNKNCFIAKIDKISIYKNHFYILDQTGKKLVVFDNKGKYLFNIGSIGKGPGQYINLTDFIIDEKEGQIELYDIVQRKNIRYSYDGKFIDEKTIPFQFLFYEKADDNYILQTRKIDNIINNRPAHYDVLILNKNNSLIGKYFEFDPSIKERGGSIDLPKVFTRYRNSLFLSKLFVDTIYAINGLDLKLHPEFLFDYGKYSLSQTQRNLKFEKALKLINDPGEYAFGHIILSISDSLICFTYGFNAPIFEKRILGLYFRKTGKCFSLGKIFNDVDDGTFSSPLACVSDTLISALYPQILNESKKSNKNKVFPVLNDNDNPILMFMKVKEPKINL